MRKEVWFSRFGLAALVLSMAIGASVAHSPIVDADLSDWCLGAASNGVGLGRVEDSSASLVCGNCSVTTDQACQVSTDCPAAETCVNLTSKTETVWWDNRTDGTVNDLGTVATTQDNTNLYIAAELWVDPDPVSLPFGEFAIDFRPGGTTQWYDPNGVLTNPGTCSLAPTRGCTSDADCTFCAVSTEPFPSTRPRTCGSGCDPNNPADTCDSFGPCVGAGSQGPLPDVGLNTDPATEPDYLIVFDFERWLVGAADATAVFAESGGNWAPQAFFFPAVNPGASGGSGGPPGSVEVAIPWSAFGCTGCPAACSCPDFGPGQDFRFTLLVARGRLGGGLDYAPDGPIEDVQSEAVGGTTTTSTNDCAGMGLTTTLCEIGDESIDSFVPPTSSDPGGQSDMLQMNKGAGTVTLNWNPSCSALDNDYEVYEGDVNSFPAYSHTQVPGLCTTGGATSATFAPSSGGRYYLVVPTDGASEGGYGERSNGTQRPAAAVGQCTPQSFNGCP